MAAAYRIIKKARVKRITAVFLLVFFAICILSPPAGMSPFSVISNLNLRSRKIQAHETAFIRRSAMELEDDSWRTAAEGPTSSSEEDNVKIARLVNRILDVERSLVDYMSQAGGLDARQLNQLELLTTQMRLVKALLEKSVYMVKLADLASHGRGSSLSQGMESPTWIAWDHLEPATLELESNVKSLKHPEELMPRDFHTKESSPRHHIGNGIVYAVLSTVLLAGLVLALYTIKRTWCVRKKSNKSMI